MRCLPYVLWSGLLLLTVTTACKGKGGSSSSSSGGTGTSGTAATTGDTGDDDAGPPPDSGVAIAPGFGPFTGTYDVSGAGLMVAVQVDNHLALQVNGNPNLYIGQIDAGLVPDAGAHDAGPNESDAGVHDGGSPLDAGPTVDAGLIDAGPEHDAGPIGPYQHFTVELIYPDLETCGPITIDGDYVENDAHYQSTTIFCTSDTQNAIEPLVGNRYLGANFYHQDLRFSGVYDLHETPTANNTCLTISGTLKVTVGVSLGEDGGPGFAFVAGDGVLDEIEFGGVSDGGVLEVNGVDPLGRPISALTLKADADGGYEGTRVFQLNGGACDAELTLKGSRRQ